MNRQEASARTAATLSTAKPLVSDMIFIVMGVSGSGKSTIGERLALRLGLPFHDADDYHSPTNVEKMMEGVPLTDEDRFDWLQTLAQNIEKWEKEGGAVVACSALKESYRKILKSVPENKLKWVYLEGSRSLIMERMKARKGHFMVPALLDSQFEALEEPAYGLHINVALPPEEILAQIVTKVKKMTPLSEFGLIGLGVMGKSLALNLAGKSTPISIYNRHVPGMEENIAQNILRENPSLTNMAGFDDLQEFIASLQRPRKILLMIYAGAIDSQIEELTPLLETGDVLIDGGNSFYKDTSRRTALLAEKGVHFVGVGISGGEEGARKGPSMMPGGPKQGYELIEKYLELIAARDQNGLPCTTYVGPEGAGHFVKMVHNSIEYAEMQLLAETYYLLRFYLNLPAEEIASIFRDWQKEGLESYLLGITIDILLKKEEDKLLLDQILDQAEQKGTGGWSVGAALEHGVPYSVLTEAVMARSLSALKSQRVEAAELHQHTTGSRQQGKEAFVHSLKQAYQATRLINHEIGFQLMSKVSADKQWALNLSEIARIWTNGCIIRSRLMDGLVEIFKNRNSILMTPAVAGQMQEYQAGFSRVVAEGVQNGFALPVLSAALNYYLGYVTADSPANMIQAQRDYFGAHTYRRKDQPADEYFHTIWK